MNVSTLLVVHLMKAVPVYDIIMSHSHSLANGGH